MNSHTPPPAFRWQDFRPLAKSETAKFYRRLPTGQFTFEDLLSVAEAALAASPGSNYALKAIKGALADFVRDDLTVVKPVELSEDEYLATVAELDDCLPTARTAKPKPCKFPSDNPLVEAWRKRYGVTVGPAPRRIRRRVRHPLTGEMCELLPSRIATSLGYKVSSKHAKVSVSIGRASYNDGWNQTIGGQVRAKIDRDENDERNFDPRSASTARSEGVSDAALYTGKGRDQRFSVACFNGKNWPKGLPVPGNWSRCFGAGNYAHKVLNPVLAISRRPVESAWQQAMRTWPIPHGWLFRGVFSLTPPPKDKLGHWREELLFLDGHRLDEAGIPKLGAPPWHREAGYFDVEWGLPDRCGKLFSIVTGKSQDWAEAIDVGGVPIRLAHGPAALGGSCAGGAAFFCTRQDNLAPSAALPVADSTKRPSESTSAPPFSGRLHFKTRTGAGRGRLRPNWLA
jgi:hypothetical protein